MREYNRAWQLSGQLRADEAIPLLKQTITVQDLQPRPLHNLKSPFRELLMATMYRRAFAPAAVAEAQAALGLAVSLNDPEIAALFEYSLAQSYIWGNDYGKAVQHGEN